MGAMVSGEGGTFAPPSMLTSPLGHFLALQQCHSFGFHSWSVSGYVMVCLLVLRGILLHQISILAKTWHSGKSNALDGFHYFFLQGKTYSSCYY